MTARINFFFFTVMHVVCWLIMSSLIPLLISIFREKFVTIVLVRTSNNTDTHTYTQHGTKTIIGL